MISIVMESTPEPQGAKAGANAMTRIDIPVAEGGLDLTQEKGVLGWWRWTIKRRPPTQRELNDRLEQLYLTLKNSTAAHKDALIWLVGLYLTRKRILRQETGAFVHAKSGERTEVKPDAIDAAQMEAAMTELMGVIQ